MALPSKHRAVDLGPSCKCQGSLWGSPPGKFAKPHISNKNDVQCPTSFAAANSFADSVLEAVPSGAKA